MSVRRLSTNQVAAFGMVLWLVAFAFSFAVNWRLAAALLFAGWATNIDTTIRVQAEITAALQALVPKPKPKQQTSTPGEPTSSPEAET